MAPTAPQLSKRVLLETQGTRSALSPVRRSPPLRMKRLTITIAMLVRCRRRGARRPAVQRPAAGHAGRRQVRSAPAPTLAEFADLGADVVKINLYWDEVAPQGRRKPTGFDGANPASYALGQLRHRRRARSSRTGMQPYLSIGGHAPSWATHGRGRAGHRSRPSAKEFRLFAQAAGRAFPNVHIWSIWNEPNLYSWLGPQRSQRHPAVALDLPRPLPGRPPRPERRRPRRRHDPARRADAARRHLARQGAPARVPARDGLPGPQLPPDPRPGRQEARLPQGRALPHLGHRLPPLHARRPARTSHEGPDDAAIGQLSRLRDDSTRSHGAASCPGACRSGSPSSATRPSRPTRSRRAR